MPEIRIVANRLKENIDNHTLFDITRKIQTWAAEALSFEGHMLKPQDIAVAVRDRDREYDYGKSQHVLQVSIMAEDFTQLRTNLAERAEGIGAKMKEASPDIHGCLKIQLLPTAEVEF